MIHAIKECDLQHNADPEFLLQAMLSCRGWAPDCADLGLCSQNGDCFSQKPYSNRKRGARRSRR